jgi:hypothetical protein
MADHNASVTPDNIRDYLTRPPVDDDAVRWLLEQAARLYVQVPEHDRLVIHQRLEDGGFGDATCEFVIWAEHALAQAAGL